MKTLYTITEIVALMVAAILIASCGKSGANADNEANNPHRNQPVTVQVKEIRPTPFVDVIKVAGFVKAIEDVMVSPEEGGVVKEWKVEKGDYVKKGDILAVLNDDVALASYEAALAQYRIAELNYTRQEKVYAEEGISELQLRNLEYTRDAAKAQADLMKARLERTRIRSPINGIVNERFAEVGEYAPPAAPIAHIVNIDRVRIAADVPEGYAGAVMLGTPVKITLDAFPGDTLEGKISFVAAAVSPSNRSLPVEVAIWNPGRKLKPEMIAKTSITLSLPREAILVSENIVQQIDRDKLVVYVESQGKAEERVVKIGSRVGGLVEIVDGLRLGDRVIVEGYQKLVNGQAVQVPG